jgi:hypothetical protein
MSDMKIRKQRSPEDMLSDNAGKFFSPPTVMYDAACGAEDAEHGRESPYGGAAQSYPGGPSEYYEHKRRFSKQFLSHQGSSTLSRDEGDFDYIGGVPKRLLNGK